MSDSIWVVEELLRGKWRIVTLDFYMTEKRAEQAAKGIARKYAGSKTRVARFDRVADQPTDAP